MIAKKINVGGVVQGVGFRPFIYRIAVHNALRGYVKNMGDAGVEIFVEGEEKNIKKFLQELRERAPPLARVEVVKVFDALPKKFEKFEILESSSERIGGDSIIPPDVAICDDCLRELFDPNDRRYLYPFIVCTNCGPRFSIIESLPYDRENTSMVEFPMCPECREEYTNPMDRRYHAEPTCCGDCGPRYWLTDGKEEIGGIEEAAKLIDEGYIVAIKGIGGFHVACDAENEDVVEKLRRRIKREQQPFAIMAKDLETVREFAYVSEKEREEMESYRRPITLLRKKEPFPLPDSIAPGLHTAGVLLPYAGVHYLLFHYSNSKVYVMTSANYPDFPMVKDNDKIKEIEDVADYFLIHNRRIVNRVDDSVVRFVAGERAVIRRSRGFVPLPVDIPFSERILSLGAELMNTFSLSKNGKIYSGQYIGNTSKIEVVEYLKDAISRLRALLNMDSLDLVVVDSHPFYNTTYLGKEIAEREGVELLKVQHHFAHIASIMAERDIDELVGIAMDAVGYGLDGKTWGGEIISISGEGIKRDSHISYFPLPGGDMASYYPPRSLIGLVYSVYGDDSDEIIRTRCPWVIKGLKYGEKEYRIIMKQLERGINVSYSSSTGRFLDAVSSFLNIAQRRTYEGEPAMKLESIAMKGKQELNFEVDVNKEIEMGDLISQIIESRYPPEEIALGVHLSMARAFALKAVEIAESRGIKYIGASGGVSYNDIIMRELKRVVEREGYTFVTTREIPRGDNGLSAGQAYLGGKYLEGTLRKVGIG